LAPAPPSTIELVPSHQLTADQRRAIIALCQACFDEDLSTFFESLGGSSHVLIWADRTLVAHACWVTRWLQPAGLPLLRTAHVKAVAVAPERQRQGYGTLAMRRLSVRVADDGYDLSALMTVIPEYYARLGWEQWRGPTAIRQDDGLPPTPGKRPMILRLPAAPPLDLDAALTAEWRRDALW
jgi:aminoglycoside 2'-N-acetyltransferase I